MRRFILMVVAAALCCGAALATDTERSRADILALFADNTSGDISPQDLRDFAVSVMPAVTVIDTNQYDLVDGDCILHVTWTDSSEVTLRLSSDQVVSGRWIVIKDGDGNASANNILISTEASETIEGAAGDTLATDLQVVRYYCDGTNWWKW